MKLTKGFVAIAGVGRMGRGIALTFAYQGYRVCLIDIKKREEKEFEQLTLQAIAEIKSQLEVLVLANIVPRESVDLVINRVTICRIDDEANEWEKADILFEAVPEIIEVKQEVFERICLKIPKETLIASTTSSFSVNDLAAFVTHKERFMNTHWLNPAYLLPLVEVSPGDKTGEQSLIKMFELLERVGKVPVICAPSPGFIVPRIQALAMNEAARLVEEGVASAEDIDKAIRTGFGIRFAVMGLLEFTDWGGADTLFRASNYLKESLQDERFAPPKIIEEKMKSGEIGMKEKKGFYDFDEEKITDYQLKTLTKFIDLLQHLGFMTVPETDGVLQETGLKTT
jgi:3-hydroxybutyryl-CoA dehydrogenase